MFKDIGEKILWHLPIYLIEWYIPVRSVITVGLSNIKSYISFKFH